MLESNYTQILGDVKKSEIAVSVSTAHHLRDGDTVTLNVNPKSLGRNWNFYFSSCCL